MILIIHEKEDKKLAVQISQSLKQKGFNPQLQSLSNLKDADKEIQAAVLIFSQKSNLSEKIINHYDYIFENAIPLIPYVISDVEFSVSMQHFLNTHDWINAYDVSQKEAFTDLAILLNELIYGQREQEQESYQQSENRVYQNKNKSTSKKKKQTYAIIGVSIVFALILTYFIFGGSNNPVKEKNNPQSLIVGNWKLAKYEDNMQRSSADYANFIKNVSALKKNFLLKIKQDNTFEKYGFAKPEYGNWELDKQNMILYMWPNNANDKQRDKLNIEKLTKDSLIMTVSSQIDSMTLINTKFVLYKE